MKKMMKSLLAFLLALCFLIPTLAGSERNTANQRNNDPLSLTKSINQFFEKAYEIYLNLKMVDMSSVLDTESLFGSNFIIYADNNTRSLQYSIRKGYTDFQRRRLLFSVSVKEISVENDCANVKVIIEGNKMKAYPWFVCFGENTFQFKKIKDKWLINGLICDDVLLHLLNERVFHLTAENELESKIDNEYSNSEQFTTENKENTLKSNPYTDHSYSTSRAVAYANQFVSTGNSLFYSISGSTGGGDCTNFISQCVSYGFGSTTSYTSFSSFRMKSGTWSAGSGGGFPAWENVDHHWAYMIQNKPNKEGPRVGIRTWSTLSNGGVMQIDFENDNDYDHSVICVSKSEGLFAQHTSNTYRHYSDYTGTFRYYQPTYYRTY